MAMVSKPSMAREQSRWMEEEEGEPRGARGGHGMRFEAGMRADGFGEKWSRFCGERRRIWDQRRGRCGRCFMIVYSDHPRQCCLGALKIME